MPNIWTHCMFGQSLAERAGFSADLEQRENGNLYRLGCQGPDLLFFHRFLPWQRGSMTKLGSAMHERHCGPFLMTMADCSRTTGERSPLFRYALGFMTHHVLDRTMHPYVFYRGGYRPWDHQRFEVAMDTLLVRAMRGIETWQYPAWTLIDAGPTLPDSIADMLQRTAAAYYPELAAPYSPADWQQAYRDMISGHKLFHDPYGYKRLLTFGRIAPMVYKRKPPGRDFLNEAKREWRHPSVADQASTASVMEMWETAMDEGEATLRAMIDYVRASEADAGRMRERLAGHVGNRSYETGRPCEEQLPLRYADPIFR